MKLQIQKLDEEAKLPSYAYKGDAGMDIYSIEDIDVFPGEKVAVHT
ncbi:dUTP diphosphatase, partial [Patescibacteria group bacterium]|nr:dUTP diphosphatase [Patescibacteria group bacterium]